MQCDSHNTPREPVVIKKCYAKKHLEVFTNYEGLAKFENGMKVIFASERLLKENTKYRFIRASPRQIRGRKVMVVFDATQLNSANKETEITA